MQRIGDTVAGILVGLLIGLCGAWLVFNGHGHAREVWRTGSECAVINNGPCNLSWRWEKQDRASNTQHPAPSTHRE